MRKTLILLSSLALAAVAGAQSTSTSTSSLIASYAVSGAVSFDSYTSFQYDHVGADFNNNTSFDDDGGRLEYELTGSTSHGHVDGNRLFSMGSQTSVAIDAPDYGAITPGANPYALSYMGYTYVLKFVVGAAGGSVRFDMHAAQTLLGSAASPYGLQALDANGDYSEGAYARGGAGGGVIDVTSGFDDNIAQDGDYTFSFAETLTDVPGVSSPTFESLRTSTFSTTFTFDTPGTRYLRLYASTYAEADFYKAAPVPEPASLAALGLGALAVLRRRRS